jgi:hypothetical protein
VNEQCKKHKYKHIQNIEINETTYDQNRQIIKIKLSFRGEYECSICGKKRIGKQK